MDRVSVPVAVLGKEQIGRIETTLFQCGVGPCARASSAGGPACRGCRSQVGSGWPIVAAQGGGRVRRQWGGSAPLGGGQPGAAARDLGACKRSGHSRRAPAIAPMIDPSALGTMDVLQHAEPVERGGFHHCSHQERSQRRVRVHATPILATAGPPMKRHLPRQMSRLAFASIQ